VAEIRAAADLIAYRKAYALAMEIFRLSKSWPSEEKYSVTDQVRRSFRGGCANLREVWAKRRYEAHFVLKLTDADGENAETATWLDFARDCGYLAPTDYARLADLCREVGSMLGAMLFDPAPFLLRLS